MTASKGDTGPWEEIAGLVEAFTGLAEAVVEMLPTLGLETQRRLAPHLAQAKMLGQLTVTVGSYELRRRAKAMIDAMAAEPETAEDSPSSSDVSIDSVVDGYDKMTASAIVAVLSTLTVEQLDAVIAHEQAHRARTTVLHRAGQLRRVAANR